jgi:hypothetical protein
MAHFFLDVRGRPSSRTPVLIATSITQMYSGSVEICTSMDQRTDPIDVITGGRTADHRLSGVQPEYLRDCSTNRAGSASGLFAGRSERVGCGSNATRLKVGDQPAADTNVPCTETFGGRYGKRRFPCSTLCGKRYRCHPHPQARSWSASCAIASSKLSTPWTSRCSCRRAAVMAAAAPLPSARQMPLPVVQTFPAFRSSLRRLAARCGGRLEARHVAVKVPSRLRMADRAQGRAAQPRVLT